MKRRQTRSQAVSSYNPITHEENTAPAHRSSSSVLQQEHQRQHGQQHGHSQSHSYGYSQMAGYGDQAQTQRHIFRSAQASKQMVYEVFGNTIGMLEEMEQREQARLSKTKLSRSDIAVPSQTEHDDKTIERKVDTQLLLLQSQLTSCDDEIKGEVTEDLKTRTLDWYSHRQDRQAKRGNTDKYAGKLFEVLAKGKTDHPEDFYKKPTMTERDMQRSLGAYMQGTHRRDVLDTSFRNDPNRRAEAPRLRQGVGADIGAERLMEERPDLASSLSGHRQFDMK